MLNDIWNELPYVLSTGWWWGFFPALLIAIPWLIRWYYFPDFSRPWTAKRILSLVLCWLLTLCVIAGYISAIVSYEDKHRYDGHHEWRDGAGPNTKCHYETRNELVGVIGKGGHYEDHTYTVCLDFGE